MRTSWTINANHGGGYQYRLCPLGEALTEACFQRMPLPFARLTQLQFKHSSAALTRVDRTSAGVTSLFSVDRPLWGVDEAARSHLTLSCDFLAKDYELLGMPRLVYR